MADERKDGGPIAIEAIDHLVLRVRNPDRSLEFYRDILGCQEERRIPEIGLVQLRAGVNLIDLIPESARAVGPPRANMDHFALRLASFDSEKIKLYLTARGIVAGPVERRYGAEGFGLSIYIADPDGNVVELKGPAEPA